MSQTTSVVDIDPFAVSLSNHEQSFLRFPEVLSPGHLDQWKLRDFRTGGGTLFGVVPWTHGLKFRKGLSNLRRVQIIGVFQNLLINANFGADGAAKIPPKSAGSILDHCSLVGCLDGVGVVCGETSAAGIRR